MTRFKRTPEQVHREDGHEVPVHRCELCQAEVARAEGRTMTAEDDYSTESPATDHNAVTSENIVPRPTPITTHSDTRVCNVPACDRPAPEGLRGLCGAHYAIRRDLAD